jgi:hypothetical protein
MRLHSMHEKRILDPLSGAEKVNRRGHGGSGR